MQLHRKTQLATIRPSVRQPCACLSVSIANLRAASLVIIIITIRPIIIIY